MSIHGRAISPLDPAQPLSPAQRSGPVLPAPRSRKVTDEERREQQKRRQKAYQGLVTEEDGTTHVDVLA